MPESDAQISEFIEAKKRESTKRTYSAAFELLKKILPVPRRHPRLPDKGRD